MILSDGLRSTALEAARGEYASDEESPRRLGETWAVTVRDTLFGADIPSVGSQPRNTAVSISLTIYESRCSRICCPVHFVGR